MGARVIITGALAAALLPAAGWSGKLVDAKCKEARPIEACPVTPATTRFGIIKSGVLSLGRRFYRFGEEGNVRVAAALAERLQKTGRFPRGNREAWLTGKPEGNTFVPQEFLLK